MDLQRLPLAQTWKRHFELVPKNEQLDKVPHLFLRATDPNESKDVRRQTIFADQDAMILAGDGFGSIQLLHSPTNLGGNFLCPGNKLVALVGSGELSGAVLIDEVSLLNDYREIEVPQFVEIRECSTADEIKALSVQNDDTLDCSGCMLLLPFFRSVLLNADSLDPIKLILAIIEAMNASDFDQAMYEYAVELCYFLWCIANDKVEGTKTVLRLDDNDVLSYQMSRQNQCISRPTQQGHQAGISDNGTFRQLSAAISMQSEETREANNLRRQEIRLSMEREEQKRDKFQKLHISTQNMILNASSTDGDRRAQELSPHAKSFYTKDSEGLADQDLKYSLDLISQENTSFAHGTVQCLRIGNYLYSDSVTPNNFSFFSFNEQSAGTSNNERQLIIHLTQSHSQGQTISTKDLRKLTKQFLLVPHNFESFQTQLKIFSAANECLFGERAATTIGLNWLLNQVNGNLKQVLKQQMSSDPTFAAQLAYAVDIRIQEFLKDCKQASDRSEVDERVVNFRDMVNDIRFQRFSMSLPPSFVFTSKDESQDIDTNGRGGDGGRDRKRPRGAGGGDEDNRIHNTNQVDEFKMRPNEDWRKDFCGRCIDDRVRWDKNSLMCPRWFTNGYCFDNCKNKASHVPASQVPADKKREYSEYLKKVRGEN